MQQEKRKGKPIGGDNIITKKFKLIPNKSYGIFAIGNDIEEYLSYPHKEYGKEGKSLYDSYTFFEEYIDVWTDENKIDTIKCTVECFWKGENLIGMTFDKFLELAGQQPDDEDVLYVPISRDRGQNQKVYDFDSLGLQVWTWRNKIKTVLISKYEEE